MRRGVEEASAFASKCSDARGVVKVRLKIKSQGEKLSRLGIACV
jgi:hypothetical protein